MRKNLNITVSVPIAAQSVFRIVFVPLADIIKTVHLFRKRLKNLSPVFVRALKYSKFSESKYYISFYRIKKLFDADVESESYKRMRKAGSDFFEKISVRNKTVE